jgi:hypothetical protein
MSLCFRIGWLAGLPALALYAGGSPGRPDSGITTVVRTDKQSGKLVRVVVNRGGGPDRSAPPAIAATVNRVAAEHVLPPELLDSVIKAESNYEPYAVSPKGAVGLMQLIPATARRFGVADAFNPVENIQGGAKYLRYLLDLYHGDYPLALAAYNAGEETVARYGGVPPFAETQKYVAQVRKRVETRVKAKQPAAPETKPESSAEPHIHEILEPDGTVRYVSR